MATYGEVRQSFRKLEEVAVKRKKSQEDRLASIEHDLAEIVSWLKSEDLLARRALKVQRDLLELGHRIRFYRDGSSKLLPAKKRDKDQ